MGINPTPTNHRSFTFDGKSTREFGVYTTGKDVFNSPERAVEMISIPGRDGEYALDKGHFNNIEVTYRAGIVSDSTTDFAEAISNFRNWLASRKGYCRLTDEYNTEEYRMAVFKNAIALEHEGLLTGEFDVTFDCKPQRYLAIGEELVEIGAWGNTEEASGSIATFEAQSDTAIKSLTADINPVQDLHGYDAPWVGGAGKNKLDSSNLYQNGANRVDIGTQTFDYHTYLKAGTYTFSNNGVGVVYCQLQGSSSTIEIHNQTVQSGTFTITQDGLYAFWIYYWNGISVSDVTNVQLELGSTATSYAPYENICPISGWGSVETTVTDDIDNPTETETYTTSLGTTVYGGTLDVVSGVLTVTWAIADLGDLNWTYEGGTGRMYSSGISSAVKRPPDNTKVGHFISDSYVVTNLNNIYGNNGTIAVSMGGVVSVMNTAYTNASTFKSDMAGRKIVYELATPTTTQLTAQQVAVIANSVNNVWANSGDVTVEYGHNPTILTNPTWFPSKPLLAVEGYGLLKLGKSEIDLDNVPVGDITLLDDSRFRLTQTAANTYSVTFTIDEGALNVGDDITASINALPFRFYIVGDGASISPSSYTVADTNSDFVSSLSLGYGGSGADFIGETVINVKFDSGTSSTITNTVSGNLVVKKTYPTPTSNITLTYSVTETVAYDASTHTITLTETATITYSSAYIASAQLRTTSLGASALITAYSTISIIQDEVFIDCDIGEAYTIKDGEPISLNQHIDLGSDLPTLPSGDTEVTYDNTITKVEVQPNWWKV